ncbi:hypothetical protein DPMN_071314 [Dreissena polymorpha]|uniref:Uncharacterized protein n=1 Tax=Dreissena polymorpha TaxID=45954 RepID=A0A9D3Z2Q3_DREPO|nr:hypothetical protein DPMN_071314 [Dreissena polymorpha]
MRSVPMVLRRYVFTRLIVEKDLSVVAVDTGMQSRTSRTRRHLRTLGYEFSVAGVSADSRVFNGSGDKICHFVFHLLHSLANVTSSTSSTSRSGWNSVKIS